MAQLTPVRTNLLGRPSVFPLPSTPYTGSPGLTNRTYLQSNVYSGKLKSQKMSVAQAIVSPKIDRLKNDSNYRTWRIEEKSNIDRRASLSGFDNFRTFARNATTPMALTPCVPFKLNQSNRSSKLVSEQSNNLGVSGNISIEMPVYLQSLSSDCNNGQGQEMSDHGGVLSSDEDFFREDDVL